MESHITVLAPAPTNIFAIYNAEGSLTGEIRYALTKGMGGSTCALCDITHGWNPRGKKAWRECTGLSSKLEWLHSDEVPPDLSVAITNQSLPCVVADLDGRIEVLIDCAGLKSCNGEFAVFEDLLQRRALDLNLIPPTSTAGQGKNAGEC